MASLNCICFSSVCYTVFILECPGEGFGWTAPNQGLCYKLLPLSCDFYTAHAQCRREGGHLAFVERDSSRAAMFRYLGKKKGGNMIFYIRLGSDDQNYIPCMQVLCSLKVGTDGLVDKASDW